MVRESYGAGSHNLGYFTLIAFTLPDHPAGFKEFRMAAALLSRALNHAPNRLTEHRILGFKNPRQRDEKKWEPLTREPKLN